MSTQSEANDLDQRLRLATNSKALLQIIHDAYWNDRKNTSFLVQKLIEEHNTQNIDIVSAFRSLENSPGLAIDFFSVRHIFEQVLPHLNAPLVQVIDCVVHLVKEAGEDLAAGLIYQPFINYCSADKSRPEEGLRLIEGSGEKYVSLLVPVLVAGSLVDFEFYFTQALRLSSANDIDMRRRALFSLGRLHYPDASPSLRKAYAFIKDALDCEDDDILLANIIEVAIQLVLRDKNLTSDITHLIDTALKKGDDSSLYTASHLLWVFCKELSEEVVEVLLKHLKKVNPSNLNCLKNIDYGLSHLLKNEVDERGIQFLEDLLVRYRGKISLEIFDSVNDQLLQNENILTRIVTRWLLRGTPELCEGITFLLGLVHDSDLVLSIDPEELSEAVPEDIIFLARKSIGYLFFKPVSAASIICSRRNLI